MNVSVDALRPGEAARALRDSLDAVERWNPHVNAVITLDADGASEAAEAADRAAADGRWLGLLHGVPVMVKDNIDTAGLRTTYASGFFRDHVPNADAPVVRRLRAAGAVIVGKATLHEFAFGVRSHNPVIGQCRNPYDLARIPGGSSGGSGVAVATGMAPMALGTDTGGSVRIPASLNGVTGLRPTIGRVSNTGCMPVSVSHDTIGPMARSVDEVARLFAVMAGHDPDDPFSAAGSLDNFLPRLSDGIAGLRIGRPRNHFFTGLDAPVAEAVERAIATLASLGATIVEIDLPGAEETHLFATTMIFCDACALHAERLDGPAANWAPQTLERMRMGRDYTGVDYARALRAREAWTLTLTRVFQNVDAIVSPTVPVVTPAIEDQRNLFEATRAVTRNTYAGAFGRLPGLSLPCGLSPEGMPIGLQLEGPPFSDALLLTIGHAFQSATDWHRMRPRISDDG